ncbi:MAG: aspartate carbamoyltransferase [Deltaproteobacteria bacterium]|nr:aspartate carbamoyltransferase [Deltaproteobacteria bacterium]
MNILDEQFAEFEKLPSEEKAKCFVRNGRLYDMIFSQQLNREILENIYHITNKIRLISKRKEGSIYLQNILCHKRAMLYFTQPSSRTFLSFENACHILGMKTSEIRDTRVSSEIKGESFDDSLRTFSSYTDLIIIRHVGQNKAERAAWLLNTRTNRPVPIINGGSGSDQHPTQAILDVYTLQRSFENLGGVDGKTILMCGDLKRGRTVRSLSYLMKNFEDVTIIFSAPQGFQMKEDVCNFLEEQGIRYVVETDALENVLPEADAIYMTRIQDEHDAVSGESKGIDTSRFTLRFSDMSKLKPHAIIMHPFPRRDEVDVSIDPDPRAMYWRQERNGMWTRAALIAYLFDVCDEIMNYE